LGGRAGRGEELSLGDALDDIFILITSDKTALFEAAGSHF